MRECNNKRMDNKIYLQEGDADYLVRCLSIVKIISYISLLERLLIELFNFHYEGRNNEHSQKNTS